MERQKVDNKSGTSGKLLDFGTVEQQKSVNGNNLFVYVFHHSNSMDMRGNINYFGGEFDPVDDRVAELMMLSISRRTAQLRFAVSVRAEFIQADQQKEIVANWRQIVQEV